MQPEVLVLDDGLWQRAQRLAGAGTQIGLWQVSQRPLLVISASRSRTRRATSIPGLADGEATRSLGSGSGGRAGSASKRFSAPAQLIKLPEAKAGAASAKKLATARTTTMTRRRMRDLLSPTGVFSRDYGQAPSISCLSG